MLTVAILAAVLAVRSAGAEFSFSEEDRKTQEEHDAKQRRQRAAGAVTLDARCRAKLDKRKTMIIVAEHVGARYRTRQVDYDPHFSVLSRDLQRLGVRVYSRAEIQAQIAQAEIDAYFKNDADAALGAAKRLGPNLVLRAAIGSRSSYNEFMGLPEVAVSIALSLTDSSGRIIAQASAGDASYSGSDTLGMALRLLNEQAPGALNRLYLDFCRRAPDTAPPADPPVDESAVDEPTLDEP
jgi:hypothetical protein